eukprot:Gregarina_sp_Poly_1__7897@NODE_449_length_8316_cov_26_811735_g367_i0_p2_GENE_NODE_449_length_8316_cov_26_811735_g367_i0NODE_449_length_8316_cov_26_811735_g367_i0_p2_ORF_typecomplete_len549_score77_77_NODE_449_length_8316_cov_26_811735_g367_i032814927
MDGRSLASSVNPGFPDINTSHIIGRALSCIHGAESPSKVRQALDGIIRLFLEEYRNRSRNDDIPQLDLRFGKIPTQLLMEVFGPVYGVSEQHTPPWFCHFLLEHVKVLADLISLQAGGLKIGEDFVYHERMRFLDIMALLASMPAPACGGCQEPLFQNCVTCHHSCVVQREEGRLQFSRKPKRRRNRDGLPAETPPSADNSKDSPVLEPLPPMQILGPASGSEPVRVLAASNKAHAETIAIPETLSSISSDVSSRSPPPQTETEPVSRTNDQFEVEGRTRRRIIKPVLSLSTTKRAPLRARLATPSNGGLRPKRSALAICREKAVAGDRIGTVMVCLNCRGRFACALQDPTSLLDMAERPRLCGGIVMLSRFSLPQIALLMILLIEKLKTAGLDSSTISLMRHMHRLPRLPDLGDLAKTTIYRIYRWDESVACSLVGSNLENIELAAKQREERDRDIGHSTKSLTENPKGDRVAQSSMNQSYMDRLSIQGLELLNKLSWGYFCASGKASYLLAESASKEPLVDTVTFLRQLDNILLSSKSQSRKRRLE